MNVTPNPHTGPYEARCHLHASDASRTRKLDELPIGARYVAGYNGSRFFERCNCASQLRAGLCVSPTFVSELPAGRKKLPLQPVNRPLQSVNRPLQSVNRPLCA